MASAHERCGSNAGFDHTNDGNAFSVAFHSEGFEGISGRGIAGDHQRFHTPSDQVSGYSLTVALDGLR